MNVGGRRRCRGNCRNKRRPVHEISVCTFRSDHGIVAAHKNSGNYRDDRGPETSIHYGSIKTEIVMEYRYYAPVISVRDRSIMVVLIGI